MAISYYSDDRIIETIRNNDFNDCNEILKHVYKIYYPLIRKFIVSNNGNDTEAKDIFQETIITFYEQVKQENFFLTCSIKTYLYSISKNLWLKRLRKLKRFDRDFTDFEDYIIIEDTDLEYNQDSQRGKILMELIEKLDERCKEILIYYYYEKMKMKEIQSKMDFGSEQSAKNKKYKCMKHLMEIIKESKSFNALKESY